MASSMVQNIVGSGLNVWQIDDWEGEIPLIRIHLK